MNKAKAYIQAVKEGAEAILAKDGYPCLVIGVSRRDDKCDTVVVEIRPGGKKASRLALIVLLREAIEALEAEIDDPTRN